MKIPYKSESVELLLASGSMVTNATIVATSKKIALIRRADVQARLLVARLSCSESDWSRIGGLTFGLKSIEETIQRLEDLS